MNRRSQIKRVAMLCALLVVCCSLMVLRLVELQIVGGASYREQAQRTQLRTYKQPASRGEILDRYGRSLVSNSLGFSISFDYFSWDSDRQNDVILKIAAITDAAGIAHYDTLPVSTEAPFTYTMPGAGEEEVKKLVSFFAENAKVSKAWRIIPEKQEPLEWRKVKDPETGDFATLGLATASQIGWAGQADYIARSLQNTTAPQLMALLREKYDIDESYSDQEARTIAGVRYEMQLFSSYNNLHTFASQVDVNTVSLVEERSSELPGVTITVDNVRQYDTTYASHVLGRVDKIYKEEYAELKAQGYAMNDIVGKDGLEKAYEKYLRGIDGKRSVETNIDGDVINEISTLDPQPGSNVVLTLDLDLQAVAEESLARNIQSIGQRGKRGGGTDDVRGGAAVVIDVNTGGILACASYPTYNLSTFRADFNTLNEDPLTPMLNRAIGGAFPPGSTFKPVTSVAALESGTITPKTKIRDLGKYMFYQSSGFTPSCWIYRDRGGTHGSIDVSGALKYSCNYFYYEVSRLMGIETLNQYGKALGLGQKTGVELPGEVAGNLAGPESREKNGGSQWFPGETLIAAIGQGEQQFTPIQMANMMATILNGGTRYQPHFLKQVIRYDYAGVVEDYQPQVLDELNLAPTTVEAVKEGMRGVVTDDGTAASVFRNYPIAIGGKTGSAQTSNNFTTSAHGVFISFAPYDEPQIAVYVLVEHGGSGGNVAPIVRDIYDAYFGKQTNPSPVVQENTLIS